MSESKTLRRAFFYFAAQRGSAPARAALPRDICEAMKP